MLRVTFFVFAFYCVFFSDSAWPAARPKLFRVALVMRTNSHQNNPGVQITEGIELATEMFERRHPGVRIALTEFRYSGKRGSLGEAAILARKENVPAVIGGLYKSEAEAVANLFQQRRVVLVTPLGGQEREMNLAASSADLSLSLRTTEIDPASLRPLADVFRRWYRGRHHRSPSVWAALGFDSAWTLFSAMDHATDPNNPSQIQSELRRYHRPELVVQKR